MLLIPAASKANELGAPQMQVKLVPKTYNGGYHITCNGAVDGSIQTVVTDGEAPYTYVWSSGATNATLDNVGAGTYSVTVTDAYGATATATIDLLQPKLLLVEATSKLQVGGTHVSQAGGDDGSAAAAISGGTPPYEYLWSTTAGSAQAIGATKEGLEGLTAGSYTVTVTDVNGCTASSTITLTEPSPLTATLSAATYGGGFHISCAKGEDGAIDLSVNGGIAPYEYSWSNGQFTEDVNGLAAGYHEVRITDANGAKLILGETLTEPQPLAITLTSPLFGNGYNVSCHACYNGTVNSAVSGGITPYAYQWESANGPAAQTAQLQNAGEKEYSLLITDGNGCLLKESIELKIPERDDWTMSGNAGVGPDQFIGTTDAADLVLKANNQPQLRLGADGISELLGGLKLANIPYSPVDGTVEGQQVLVINPDGSVVSGGPPPWTTPGVGNNPVGGCFDPDQSGIDVMGSWSYDLNKIYTCPQVNVGIGYENPAYDLHVKGDGKFSGDVLVATSYSMKTRIGTLNEPQTEQVLYINSLSNIDNALVITDPSDEQIMVVKSDGKVGIGTDEPVAKLDVRGQTVTERLSINTTESTYELEVCGTIRSKEVIVEVDGWCDYVFEDEYELRSIEALKTFISENGHLPEVPSTKEVSENGVELGDMNKILLKKVEELTLYVIELKEANDALQKQVSDINANNR